MIRPQSIQNHNARNYPSQDKEEQKNLINKLIGRIQKL